MLTARQSAFVSEYLVCRNGTQAAIRAGYSAKTARAIACENLKKPAIAAAIANEEELRRTELNALQLQTLTELARIAFSDMSGVMGADGHFKPPREWTAEDMDGIGAFQYKEKLGQPDEFGNRSIISSLLKVKAHDKFAALEQLGKYAGLFPRRAGRPRKMRDI